MVLRFKGVFSCHKRQIRGRTDAPSYIPVTSIEFRQQLRRAILAADKHHTFYMSSPHKPSIEIDYKKHTMKNQKSYRASCRKLQVKSPTVAHSNHLYHCIPLLLWTTAALIVCRVFTQDISSRNEEQSSFLEDAQEELQDAGTIGSSS